MPTKPLASAHCALRRDTAFNLEKNPFVGKLRSAVLATMMKELTHRCHTTPISGQARPPEKNTTRSFISKCTLNLYFHHQLDFKALINLWCTTVQTKNCVCFILRFIAKLYILALCCRSTHKCLENASTFANKFGHLLQNYFLNVD